MWWKFLLILKGIPAHVHLVKSLLFMGKTLSINIMGKQDVLERQEQFKQKCALNHNTWFTDFSPQGRTA